MSKRQKERAWKAFMDGPGSCLVLSDPVLCVVKQAFMTGYTEGLTMEVVKWHGINRPGDDLVVCIRGAYWDVMRHDVTGDWQIHTPDGNITGKYPTRERAKIAAEEIMKKWGVI